MRRKALALALITTAVGCLAAAAFASVPTTRGTSTAAADQIRAAENTHLRAAVDADAGTARQLLAPDFQLIDALGAPESKKAYLDTIAGVVDFVTLKPVSPMRVRLYGNTAVVRFQAAFEVVAGPDRLRHRGWITDLFERRNGRWLLVWSQTTPTPNNPDLLVQALKAHS
jgi:hypothetical protein